MANVAVIAADGTETTFTPNNSSFQLFIDGDAHEPAVTQRIEVESNSTQATTGTQCGTQKTINTSTDPFQVTVEGIITNSDLPEELTVENLLFDVNEGDELQFTSDFPSLGFMKVSNILVEQVEDVISVQTAGLHDFPETAFRFQIQFGQENNK